MPSVQLVLKSGVQSVQVPNEIMDTGFKLKCVEAHFNRANHGFYFGKIYLSIMNPNNVVNNIGNSRAFFFSVDPTSPYSITYPDLDIGVMKMTRSFSADVQMQSGLQVLNKSLTTSTQPYAFIPDKSNTSITAYDYVNTTAAQNAGTNPYTCDKTSLGVLADVCTTTTSAYLDTNGNPTGPVPFLYSLIITLEYDNPIL